VRLFFNDLFSVHWYYSHCMPVVLAVLVPVVLVVLSGGGL
jgi:hypothetical protein